jgi:hypothetical protein
MEARCMKNREIECACPNFERLEGAAVQAYIAQFLERAGADQNTHRTYYTCRVCGAPWMRAETEDQRKASLIRQELESKA